MDIEFSGEMWLWEGPAAWHFVTVPEQHCNDLRDAAAAGSKGWGMIPVTARIGRTEWTTSLYPQDGQYVVPVKAAVRRAERIDAADVVTVRLTVDA